MRTQLNFARLMNLTQAKAASFVAALAVCLATYSATPAIASYIVGDVTASGGVVTAVTAATITVSYDISKTAYIDSYYAKDEMGATTTAKIVVNGSSTSAKGSSVSRELIATPTVDTIDGYSVTSAVLNLACTYDASGWSVRAYAVTQDWTEGTTTGGQTKSGAATYGATWLTSDGSTAWAGTSGSWTMYGGTAFTGGGSAYDALTYADATEAPVSGEWTTVDLTSVWSEVSEYGIVLTAYNTTTGITEDTTQIATDGYIRMIFATDDWVVASSGTFANVDASPYLSVTYAVPEPAALATLGFGLVGLLFARRNVRSTKQ